MCAAYFVKNITSQCPGGSEASAGIRRALILMNDRLQVIDSEDGFTLQQVCELLDGKIVCGEEWADQKVASACGCDLMSDVLAFTRSGSVLLTGLTNSQVVRTAEMLDLKAVVFVRSKRPDENTISMAKSLQLVLICSPHPLYESCGRLYAAGLSGCNGSSRSVEAKTAEV